MSNKPINLQKLKQMGTCKNDLSSSLNKPTKNKKLITNSGTNTLIRLYLKRSVELYTLKESNNNNNKNSELYIFFYKRFLALSKDNTKEDEILFEEGVQKICNNELTMDSFLESWVNRHNENTGDGNAVDIDSKQKNNKVLKENKKKILSKVSEDRSNYSLPLPKIVENKKQGNEELEEANNNKEEKSNKECQKRVDVMLATTNLKLGKFRKLKSTALSNSSMLGIRKNKFWKLSLSERIQEQVNKVEEEEEQHSYKQRILYTKETKSFDNGNSIIKQSSTLTTMDDNGDDDYQCYLSTFSTSNDICDEDEYDTVYETGDLNNIFIQSDLNYHCPTTRCVHYNYSTTTATTANNNEN